MPDLSVEAGARRRWAGRLLCKVATLPPRYGSSDWLALPDGDPSKVAACVVAAECWARAGDDLADDLRAEVDNLREAFKREEDAEYVASWEEARRRWAYLASPNLRLYPLPGGGDAS